VRIARSQRILDLKALPLIAIREFIISRKSLGGIQTDLECRALDERGEAIPGLYAIGEAAGFGGGGLDGLRALEGTFLGACVLTSRAAADSIAHG
jgi:predicted oxidoreductase